jgi:hypothetical protein
VDPVGRLVTGAPMTRGLHEGFKQHGPITVTLLPVVCAYSGNPVFPGVT